MTTLVKSSSNGNWADSVDDVTDDIKSVVEYTTNEKGQKVKITRKIKFTIIKVKASHVVAERKKWKKYGDVKGMMPGPDTKSTSLGEIVHLRMGIKKDEPVVEVESATAKIGKSISCRTCKGDHYTFSCPYKDTLGAAMEEDVEKERTSNQENSGKYVPRHKREGADQKGESMDRRDDYSTIRITNLSGDVQDQDLRDLCSKFGNISRVYVARGHNSSLCKGFAFVSFYDRVSAENALRVLNGKGYDNLILSVEWAKSSK